MTNGRRAHFRGPVDLDCDSRRLTQSVNPSIAPQRSDTGAGCLEHGLRGDVHRVRHAFGISEGDSTAPNHRTRRIASSLYLLYLDAQGNGSGTGTGDRTPLTGRGVLSRCPAGHVSRLSGTLCPTSKA